MSELLRELEDDIRAERWQQFWARFGKTAVYLSIAIVAGVAAGVMWRNWQESNQRQATHQLLLGDNKMREGDHAAAIAAYDNVEGGTKAVRALALLRKAEAQKRAGDAAGAKVTLDAVIASSSDDTSWIAELALLLQGGSSPVADDTAFALSLRESRAWALMAEGKKDEAAAAFTLLYHDSEQLPTLRQRTRLALQSLSPEALDPKP